MTEQKSKTLKEKVNEEGDGKLTKITNETFEEYMEHNLHKLADEIETASRQYSDLYSWYVIYLREKRRYVIETFIDKEENAIYRKTERRRTGFR